MKKHFLFLIFFAVVVSSYGQKQGQARIDSLVQLLNSDKYRNNEDTNKVKILNWISLCRIKGWW